MVLRLKWISATGTLTPVGLSHLHALSVGAGRGADLIKLLFVVLDVMRKRSVDVFESMEMIGEHPGIRSEQGTTMLDSKNSPMFRCDYPDRNKVDVCDRFANIRRLPHPRGCVVSKPSASKPNVQEVA